MHSAGRHALDWTAAAAAAAWSQSIELCCCSMVSEYRALLLQHGLRA